MTSNDALARCVLVLGLATFAFHVHSASTNTAPADRVIAGTFPTLKQSAVALAPKLKGHTHQRQAELPALSPLELESIAQQDRSADRKRLRIAVGRVLPEPLVVDAQTVPASSWSTLPDESRICTVLVTSHGAMGLRAHIEDIKLPAGARLIVYNPNSPEATAAPVPPQLPDTEPGVWAPTVFGEDVVVECQLPAGADPVSVSFSVTGVSHQYRGLKAAIADINASLCEHDAVCFPAWENEAAGVARIDFVEKGNGFACTGCLIKDRDPATDANYFLTAHHCISSKTVAATLEALWGFQATICDDPNSVQSGVQTVGGAALLATSAASDFTLLQLFEDPPGGAHPVDWSTNALGDGEAIVGIHHPYPLEKKISFGNQIATDRDFWHVQWNLGVTEEGSSGSPLFDANHKIVGQLFGGTSACDNQSGEDVYGRLDVSYKAMRKWIDNYAFVRVQGAYNGLFADSGNPATESSGFLTLTLRDQGAYSGSVQLAGKKYSISGQFDQNGTASNNVSRSSMLNPLTIQMNLNIAPGAESLNGTVSDGTWTADLLAKRAAFNAKTNPAPFGPKYTAVFPGGNSIDAPGGYGFATINVDMNGKARVAGSLPDGSKMTQSVPIAPDLTLPLFVSLYSGKGVADGWLVFNNSDPATDLSGSVSWIKDPIATAKFYPAGFNLSVSAMGELYTPPASGAPILDFSSGTVSFADGNLDAPFSNDVTLSASSKIANESANKLSMSFVLSSGLFNGSVTPPSGGRAFPFHGIVLQNSGAGYGYFLGTSQSGSVTVEGQ
jgi:hypothetical protein